jgi:hypothetical protein
MNTQIKSKTLAVAELDDAYEGLALAAICISDLSALFRAIRGTSDENSLEHHLSGIGTYIGDTWESDIDLIRENFNKTLEKKE